MSIKQNTTDLQAILDAVNALPEAGSSGAVETCTVTIRLDCDDGNMFEFYAYYINSTGMLVTIEESVDSDGAVCELAVAKNSMLIIDSFAPELMEQLDSKNIEYQTDASGYNCYINVTSSFELEIYISM